MVEVLTRIRNWAFVHCQTYMQCSGGRINHVVWCDVEWNSRLLFVSSDN